MMRIISVVAIGLFFVACQRAPTPERPTRQITEKEVEGVVLALNQAYAKGDKAVVERTLDEAFLGTDGTGTVNDKARALSFVGAFSDNERTRFDYSDWKLHQLGNIVIAKFRVVTHYQTVSGQTKDYRGVGTAVLVDDNGKLKLVSNHHTDLPPERKTVQVSNDVLKSYAGKYESPFSGNTYEISHKDGKLVVGSTKKPGVTFAYEATSETEFFYPGDKATVEFVKGNDGKVSHYVVRSPDQEKPIEVKRVD